MSEPHLAAIVLAAGSSARLEGAHKLLEPVGGSPMIVRAVDAALTAGADPVVVVTGARADDVSALVPKAERVMIAHNAAHATGLASSLLAGVESLPADVDGVIVALADMPFIRVEHYRALLAHFAVGAIVVPVRDGRRGNPVVWASRFFDEMCGLEGDQGAKSLMGVHADAVVEVPTTDDAYFVDVDDRADLERARGAD